MPPHSTTNATSGTFNYMDPASYRDTRNHPDGLNKPWSKVDGPGKSFQIVKVARPVQNIRGREADFGVDVSGFAHHFAPAAERDFTDERAIREGYYAEVEQLLRAKLPGPGRVKKVVIFDHTIRRNDKASPRQPVQRVHVDQTPRAAAARVRRHLPAKEAEALLRGRYQILNVWRPIGHVAADFPLALVDYRTTRPDTDLIPTDLLYPRREKDEEDDDDRGKEVCPDPGADASTEAYEVKGETFGVAPNETHRFYYVRDMGPDEALFIKCFDSRSEVNGGPKGVAAYTPHTAFVDPQTPPDALGRQSIEVRCLVFYE